MRTGKRPTASSLMFALIALVASAGFVRLGLWQLSRHSEVSAASQARSQLLELEPVRLDASTLDSVPVEELVGRRVTVSGTWDFGGEVVGLWPAGVALARDGLGHVGEIPSVILLTEGRFAFHLGGLDIVGRRVWFVGRFLFSEPDQ